MFSSKRNNKLTTGSFNADEFSALKLNVWKQLLLDKTFSVIQIARIFVCAPFFTIIENSF